MSAYTPVARPPLTPRFTRVREGRVVAGVAAGLSEHLLVDVRYVRLFFTLTSLAGGLGALLYLAVWVMTPLAPGGAAPAGTAWPRRVDYLLAAIASAASLATLQVADSGGSAVTAVLGLVAVGAVLALQAYDRGRGGGGTAAALAAGIALIFGGVIALAVMGDAAGTGGVVAAVAATFFGVGVVVVPVIARLARSLVQEREEKAAADQRAEIASRLHDSVLQTLALIQKRAGDPEEVARLARGQERELRAWLFDAAGKMPGSADAVPTVFAALGRAAGEVEDLFGVVVNLVTVGGECGFDAATEPVVLAAREAMVNAAAHAGVERVDVYAEYLAGELAVFVRDRGAGFDPAAVPADRHGVRDSITGRMARAGGVARVTSAPGEGTEVELTLRVGEPLR